jgi:TolB-like protein
MSTREVDRRLAAILSGDVVGYSRLMADDEDATVRTLAAYREQVGILVRQARGRLVDFTGDNFLAEFSTATAAVACAGEIQSVLRARNARLPAERRMQLRIGLHLGEVRVEGKRVYGDGVNVAARLQALAEPGGICVSAPVREQLGTRLAVSYHDLGPQSLKNISEPVRAYHVRPVEPAAVPVAATPGGRRWAVNASLAVVALAAIVAGWLLLTRVWGGAPASPIRSLAVLPLENLSGDPEQEYFADGMTETLIGDLGKIGALKVISRTSVMQYKGARKPLREIATELGVDALLEGTVSREGDRVRVTAQLIDGRTDHHLWSERYDRDLRGILELQSDVARSVARAVELELSPAEAARLAPRGLVDPAAHDAFLEGLFHIERFTLESTRSAIASFERAIEIDPTYAPAHAHLGGAWGMLANDFFAVPHSEGIPKARAAALRALELDGELAYAHALLGAIAQNFDWDWPAGKRHLARALELNPSLAEAHLCYAWHLETRGHHEEAIAENRRAVELAPLDLYMRNHLAIRYWLARRYDEAFEQVRLVLERDPNFAAAQFSNAVAFGTLGRYEEQIDALERMPGFPPAAISAFREALSREGHTGYAHAVLGFLRSAPRPRPFDLALIHGQLGERDEAFAELERSYAARDGRLVYLRVDPRLDPLRDDPRFADLVRRIGIPES